MSSYEAFAGCYDELTGNVDYEKRGEYFKRILHSYKKDSGILLDLACGTGSLSEYFAKENYDVIGVDSSEDMLAVAMEKKQENGGDITYICQNMLELNLFGTVDIAICALDSINHLNDSNEVLQTFERISLFLNEHSLLIFDVNSIYKHEQVLANNTFVYDCDNVYCVWQNSLKPEHIVEINLDIFDYDSKSDCYYRSQETFAERAYSNAQICELLDIAGFELLAVYADDTFEKPQEKTERLIYVATNKTCKNKIPQ